MITRAHSVAIGISAKILPPLGADCGTELKFPRNVPYFFSIKQTRIMQKKTG